MATTPTTPAPQMDPPVSHPQLPMILAIGITAIIFGLGGYVIASMANSDTSTDATVTTGGTSTAVVSTTPTAKATATSSTDETKDWKTYTNTDLKISFKYPTEFGDVTVKKDDYVANSTAAATGKEIVLSFSKNSKLSAGTITADFSASRGAALYEVKNFSFSNNKCSYTLGSNTTINCTKTTNQSSTDVYYGQGTSFDIPYLVGYVPLKVTEYKTLTFAWSDVSQSNTNTLKLILESSQHTN